MAVSFAAGIIYNGTDLGFNSTAVAAATAVNGLSVPVGGNNFFLGASIFLANAGLSTNIDLNVSIRDETLAGGFSPLLPVVTNINITGGPLQFAKIRISGATVLADSGGTPNNLGSMILTAPGVRFTVDNQDGVNAATVTLLMILV